MIDPDSGVARPKPVVRTAIVAALCFVALAAGARSAAAATDAQREARRAFESAEAHFRVGEYAEALADYQAGYEASPLPGFLVNIGQCQRRLGDLKKARATYQKFVIVAPDSPLLPQVKGLINELDRLLAELDDEKPPAATALSAQGHHEQASDATPVLPATADPLAAVAPPASTPAALLVTAPVPPAEKPASRKRWWLWGGIGTALACAVVAAFLLGSGADTVHDGSLATLRR